MNAFIADILSFALAAFVFLMLVTAVVNLFIRVPYVPSRKKIVRHLIKLAHIQNGQTIYDLGCGDGRFLVEAEKMAHQENKQIQAIGFELAPLPFLIASFKKLLYRGQFKVSMKNFFHENLSKADMIFCYLGPETLKKLAEKMQKECRKGTKIYSHTFKIEGLTPAKVWVKNPKLHLPTIYLYQI